MIDMQRQYTISEVSELTDYPPHVLRYYEKEFELDIPRNESNHRYYTYKEIEIIQYIKSLQNRGFSNKQIKLIIKSPELVVNNNEETAITTIMPMEKLDINNLSQEISNNLHNILNEELKPLIDSKYGSNEQIILELKEEIKNLREEISSKERDVLICENAKLKMKIKEKSYEAAELREELKRKENANKGFFKKMFKSKN
ncbi:helix-turn-helix domain-containing protein [Sporanaerobacter acetigenes]|uniref:DNA-binding transcriptional regulator, MerR family n=1 Tax=Sporanaerobacter acetigenes DSM 13106 TaxID=1123281 RepID=A0A1M5XLW4_9FIRM|nr:helix-turn-helix domain-containing protein [Sporanaerobacter acetigenes]SHI00642.1 DNA-binding transcriptional regulator, MerR family [Sporanaerobacter acetigenes DSM 13106]